MNDPTDRLLDLLDREGPSLYALMNRLTLDRHGAEDLMQELFLKMSTSAAFMAARNPPAYLRQAAIHLALDWRRRRQMPTEMPEQTDAGPAAGAMLVEREEWGRILDAATDLPGLTREAFVLHYLEELSFVEAGRVMGKTAHQVRGLCHKAVEQLRGQLGAEGDGEDGHGN